METIGCMLGCARCERNKCLNMFCADIEAAKKAKARARHDQKLAKQESVIRHAN